MMHLEGIISGTHGDIAVYIKKNLFIKGYDTTEKLENLSRALHPIYVEAVLSKGYIAYVNANPLSAKTRQYIADRSGFPESIVLQYLCAIEDAAKRGIIPASFWNPKIQEDKTGLFDSIGKNVGEYANKTVNKIFIVAGILGAIYILSGKLLRR